MQRNKKLAILIVLMTGAVFVWIPRDKITKYVLATSSPSSAVRLDQPIPVTRVVPRKRTEFVDWPRDPFAKPQEEKKVNSFSDLELGAIMWDDKNPSAFIKGKIVGVGDKIDDKTVKQIERDRVILTDGTTDYVLKLNE